MRAELIYEDIRDILKGKSKKEIKASIEILVPKLIKGIAKPIREEAGKAVKYLLEKYANVKQVQNWCYKDMFCIDFELNETDYDLYFSDGPHFFPVEKVSDYGWTLHEGHRKIFYGEYKWENVKKTIDKL